MSSDSAAGIDPTAYVDPRGRVDNGATLGAHSRVWANAHVLGGATIGAHVNVGEGCFVEGGVSIGDWTTIKNQVAIWDGVTIEACVFLGPACVFTNDRQPRSHPEVRTPREEWQPTRVRYGASIGANATIVCGTTIGEWAMIAAGSVVTKDIPAHALVRGVPARVVGYACSCGATLPEASDDVRTCRDCARTYRSNPAEPDGLLADKPLPVPSRDNA